MARRPVSAGAPAVPTPPSSSVFEATALRSVLLRLPGERRGRRLTSDELFRAENRRILELGWTFAAYYEADALEPAVHRPVFADEVVLTLSVWRRGGGPGRLRIRVGDLRGDGPLSRPQLRRARESLRAGRLVGSFPRQPRRSDTLAQQARRHVSELVVEPVVRSSRDLRGALRSGGELLGGWLRVRCSNRADAHKVVRILEDHPGVAECFLESSTARFRRGSADGGGDDAEALDFAFEGGVTEGSPRLAQRYRFAAPEGVGADVLDVLSVPGGDGAGVHVVDVEEGWWQGKPLIAKGAKKKGSGGMRVIGRVGGHPDLPLADETEPPSVQGAAAWHGARVIGVISSRADGADSGILGLAPAASLGLVGAFAASPGGEIEGAYEDDVTGALAHVLEQVVSSDRPFVVLLEVQTYNPDHPEDPAHIGPVVLRTDVRSAVSALVEAGAVVVIASGNRSLATLGDRPEEANFDGDLVRELRQGRSATLRVRDLDIGGGGLLVTSGVWDRAAGRWLRKAESVFGQEVELFAHGAGVLTTDFRVSTEDGTVSRDARLTDQFADTSAAAAIVAGAAAVACSLGLAAGRRLSSAHVRALFAQSETLGYTRGTVDRPTEWVPAFKMPDLVRIAASLELLPGLRIRGAAQGGRAVTVELVSGEGSAQGLSLTAYGPAGRVATTPLRGAGSVTLVGEITKVLLHFGETPAASHPALDPRSASWRELVDRGLALALTGSAFQGGGGAAAR